MSARPTTVIVPGWPCRSSFQRRDFHGIAEAQQLVHLSALIGAHRRDEEGITPRRRWSWRRNPTVDLRTSRWRSRRDLSGSRTDSRYTRQIREARSSPAFGTRTPDSRRPRVDTRCSRECKPCRQDRSPHAIPSDMLVSARRWDKHRDWPDSADTRPPRKRARSKWPWCTKSLRLFHQLSRQSPFRPSRRLPPAPHHLFRHRVAVRTVHIHREKWTARTRKGSRPTRTEVECIHQYRQFHPSPLGSRLRRRLRPCRRFLQRTGRRCPQANSCPIDRYRPKQSS
jgi:hypothetical protein